MNPSPSMPEVQRSRFSVKRVLLLALPCVAIIGAVAFYFLRDAKKVADADYLQLVADYTRRFGPRLTLDGDRYTDSAGDLVADVPKDGAKLIDPQELVFTGIVLDAPEKAQVTWAPLTEYLSKEAGRPVRFDTALTGIEPQLTALRDGKLHVTAFSTGACPRRSTRPASSRCACRLTPAASSPIR